MALLDDINRVLRDFERYTGDGKPGAPTAAPLPTGDPSTGRRTIPLYELRELLKTIAQTMGDPAALAELQLQIGAAGRIYSSRASAEAGAATLPTSVSQVLVREGTALVIRARTAFADDPLYLEGARWGVVQRLDVAAETAARQTAIAGVSTQVSQEVTAREAAVGAVALQVSSEVDTRSGLIDGDSPDGMIVEDEAGFVIARLRPDGLSLMDKMRIAPDDAGGLVVLDDLGFEILRATPNDFRWMGQQMGSSAASIEASLPAARAALDSVLVPGARSLVRWRRARAAAIQGTGHARVLFLGDSNTAGHSALGVGLPNRRLSTPDTTARLLPASYGATRDNVTGAMITGNGTDPAYDPRFAPGAGWVASGPVTVGGNMWQNSTTTNAMMFSPDAAWNTADVWVALDSAATLEIGLPGDRTSHTPAVGSVVKLTFTAPTLAKQTLQIARVSGTVRVVGFDCYRAGEGMSVINAGRSGTRSDQIADSVDWFGPRQAAIALAPNLTVIQIGLNDIAQGISPSVFKANIEALADAMTAAGSDLIMTVPMNPSEPRDYPWAEYVAAIYSMAAARGLAVADISRRLGTYPEASTAGWTSDTLHPNATGYAESAILHTNLMTI